MGKNDTSHGGTDPGASGNGIIEKDLALQISNYMYNRLKELGVPVKITRSTDETLSPTERVNRVLNAYGNDDDVIVISNHINAGGGEGAEVIYALRDTSTLPNLILSELEDEGQITRKAYQRRLPSNTAKDYYFMQRNTGNTQSITVEYGFLDNANDSAKLKNNYIDYTDAVIRALLEYIGYSGGDNTYTVKSGDSFWSIAKKFDVSVQELKDINNLTSNLLKVGQVLIIPQKQTSTGNTYIVKSGDTLYSIANKYNTTVDNLKNLNNLTSNTLSIGDTLKVSSNGIVPNNMMTYTVKKGDSLYSIANNYNVTVQELKNTNNLNSNLLNIGQVLNIPTELDETIYVVKRGDNIYSIANKYNTTVDEIKRKNGLTTNLLNIGQTLMV